MGADDSDFTPGFSFDFTGLSQPTQAAWEFSGACAAYPACDVHPRATMHAMHHMRHLATLPPAGALREAKAEAARTIKTKATSIDDKIQSRLNAQAAAKQVGRNRPSAPYPQAFHRVPAAACSTGASSYYLHLQRAGKVQNGRGRPAAHDSSDQEDASDDEDEPLPGTVPELQCLRFLPTSLAASITPASSRQHPITPANKAAHLAVTLML